MSLETIDEISSERLKRSQLVIWQSGLASIFFVTLVIAIASTKSRADDVKNASSIELGAAALNIQWSADGGSLLAFTPIRPSERGCRVLRIDPDARAIVKTIATDPTGEAADYAAFSPDGRRWAQQDSGKPGVCRIQIGDTGTGKIRLTLPDIDYREWQSMGLMRMAFSGDGKLLFMLQRNGHAQLWDTVTGEARDSLKLQDEAPMENACLSPDGQRIASVGQDTTLKLWDVRSGTSKSLDDNVTCHNLAFSPDSRLLAVASNEGVQVWEVAHAKKVLDLQGQEGFIYSLAFAPDSKRLATGTIQVGHRDPQWRGSVRIWDLTTGKPDQTMSGFKEGVLCLAFSRDGKRLASSSNWETDVKVWKVN